MDPTSIITVALAADIIKRLSSLILNRDKSTSEQREEQIAEAKQEYDAQSPAQKNPKIETDREELLKKLTQLRINAGYFIPNKQSLDYNLSIISMQIVQTYKAQTELDIKLINVSLESTAREIEEYEKAYKSRQLARLLAFIVPTVVLIVLIIVFIVGAITGKPDINTVIPIIQMPLIVLLWSMIGSFTAILYRFNKSGDAELEDPLRWVFTRPLTGIIMGILSYYVILAGLLAIVPKDASPATNISSSGIPQIFWIIAFITSFSDRFADTILRSLFGRFGGDTQKDFVSSNIKSISSYLQSVAEAEISGNTSVNTISLQNPTYQEASNTTVRNLVQNMNQKEKKALLLDLMSDDTKSQSSIESIKESLLDSQKSEDL